MKPAIASLTNNWFGFNLTLLYLIFDYGRPQDKIPVLGVIRPTAILSVLMIVSWLYSGFNDAVKSRQIRYLFYIFLLLASYIPFAKNNFWAFAVARGFLMYFPFIISVCLYVDSIERLKTVMNLWIALMIYIAINGILGKGIGGGNFLSDENDFGLVMCTMLPFGIFLFLEEKIFRKKMIYMLGSVLAIMGIVKSMSRGAFVGFLVVFIIVWLFSPRKIMTLIVAGMLALVLFLTADPKYWEDMNTIVDTKESTAATRLQLWEGGWNMFKAHPLGVGGGNFPVWISEYQPTEMKRGYYGTVAHSLWFTLLPELGVIGVVLYGRLLHQNIRDIFSLSKLKDQDNEKRYLYYLSLAFIGSLAGYFSAGSFLAVLYYPHYFYITAFIIATKQISNGYISTRRGY